MHRKNSKQSVAVGLEHLTLLLTSGQLLPVFPSFLIKMHGKKAFFH
jgi:hypothetical protein